MSAAAFVPAKRNLTALKRAARLCRGCPLYKNATQTVFGDGARRPEILFIGEQPGNDEDLQGKPFVGPAGKVLHRAINAAGLNDRAYYVTNAVKHFKFQRVGKRRIHQKPRDGEIDACRPWFEAEIETLKPAIIVCLGASACYSVFQKKIKLTASRGKILESAWGVPALITFHPSSVLRVPDSAGRVKAFEALVRDLKQVRKAALRAAA